MITEKEVRNVFKKYMKAINSGDSRDLWDEWNDTKEKAYEKGIDVPAITEPIMDADRRLQKFKGGYYFQTKIRKYCNERIGSDRRPYEVVRVISDKTVEVRELDAKQTVFPKEFVVGGFSAHCVDNHNQDYEYTSNPDNPIKRLRKGQRGWGNGYFTMADEPIAFHDYNF